MKVNLELESEAYFIKPLINMTFIIQTFNETFFPNVTSPETVRWSNSSISGILSNLLR